MVTGDNSLYFATGLDNSGLSQGAFDAVGIIQGLGQKISKINPFAALAVGAVSAFGIIAKEGYTMARNFEQSMKEVETISSAVQDDFDGISKSVFDLSKITPDNPEKIANAYYQIVSAGYDGAEGLRILETAAKAAVAGVTQTATAADGITTILNAYKYEAEQSQLISDALFNTVKLGKTTYDELGSSISNVAPIAASANIPLNEILSTIATLTKQGVPTAQATTQIRAAIVGLQRAGELDGAKTFQDNMQSLFDSLDGNQTLIMEQVGSVEALQAILAVSGKNALSAKDDLESYNDTVGATEEAFQRMASSNINQWQILQNRIKGGLKGLGDAALEFSSGLAKGMNDLLEPVDSVVVSLEKQRLELLKLESKIKDVNITDEERLKLIKELKEQYPELLSKINAETVSNSELAVSISKINDQLINQIILREKQLEVDKENQRIAERRITLIERENEVREQLVQLAEKDGKTIKDNATLLEQGLDLLSQYSDQEKSGGRLVNPLVEFSFQLSQLQKAQELVNFQEERGADILKEKEELAKRLGITLTDNANKVDESNNNDDEGGDGDTNKTYEDYLNERKALYESYENYVDQLGQEKADERFAQLIKEGVTYEDFLKRQLERAKSFTEEKAIIDAAAAANIDLNKESLDKVELTLDIKPIVQEVEIDETSVRALEKRIDDLNEDYRKARTDTEREVLADKIRFEQQKLDQARRFLDEEENLYGNLQRNISDLRNKELRSYIQLWRKKLDVAERGSAAAIEAEGNILDAQEQIGQNIQNTISDITGVLGEASNLFRKFGDEDTAQLLDQLSGVASGVGSIAEGIASKNPLAIAQGVFQVASSALTVEVVSDTAQFEAAIADLEKAIDKLDYVISNAIGRDKITSRLDAIEDLQELEEQAERARQAELEARREVKLLGITIGDKGEGSGTDPAKLEELEQQAEDARRRVEELKNELNELYTGATSTSLADSIIDGFKEGKRSAADFADTFEELMRNAIFEALKLKYLEKASNDFFEQFGALAGDDDGLTVADINQLSEFANNIFANSVEEMEALNRILEEAGIAGGVFTNDNRQGLSGAISAITEDTANILAGTLNSIRLDVAEALRISEQSSRYLYAIVQNTKFNSYLESIDQKISNIESSLNQFEANGL